MTFALPAWPGFTDAEPFLISKDVEPEVVLAGEQQRFGRIGSRMGVKVTLPPMEWEDARLWVAALMRAQREPATYEWPQPGFDPVDVGATTIGEASSANATVIAVANLAGGAVLLGGQWFTHARAGRKRLYMAVQTGTTPIIIGPPLRTPAVVGDALDFRTPIIEGLVDSGLSWTVNAAHHYGLTFTIREDK